jgi:chromosome segregation ATPase
MKYIVMCSILALAACSMPGVGELEERVDVLEGATGYDDTELVSRMDGLEEQYGALEDLLALPADYATDSTVHGERPSIDPAQILLLQETLTGLTDSLTLLRDDLAYMTDSLSATSEALEEVGLAVDSLTAENEEMKSDLEDLQGALWSMQQTAQDEMSTSGRTGGTGDRGTGTGGGTSRGSGTGGGTSGR